MAKEMSIRRNPKGSYHGLELSITHAYAPRVIRATRKSTPPPTTNPAMALLS